MEIPTASRRSSPTSSRPCGGSARRRPVYAAAKLLLVLAMTATVFPAYALARLVVPPWYALAAAAGATIVPALAYSSILVEEPLAYPLATLALWLIARVYVHPTWGRAGLAVLACTAAMLTRTQLSILFALFVLGLLWLCWQSERSRRWRSSFTGWDWVGLVTLGVGAAVGASALLGHLSKSWRDTTGAYPERILEHAAWASGALAIGIGVLPLLAGIAALARPRGELIDPKTRAFVITSVFALVVFVAYAGIKGAQISITFSTLVVERNLIYLCPILFAATALAFVRGVGRGWAIAGATVFTVYVVTEVPLRLDNYPYYEAHGLSMPAFLNREWGWPEGRIESTLLAACFVSVGILVALRYLRRGSHVFTAVAATAARCRFRLDAHGGGVCGRRRAPARHADRGQLARSLRLGRPRNGRRLGRRPRSTDDRRSHRCLPHRILQPLGQEGVEHGRHRARPRRDPDAGPRERRRDADPVARDRLRAHVERRRATGACRQENGPLHPVRRQPGATQARLRRERHRPRRLDRRHRRRRCGRSVLQPLRHLARRTGFAGVNLSRVAWCSGGPPGKATVRIGPIGIGPDSQPAISEVTQTQTKTVTQCTATGFRLAAPQRSVARGGRDHADVLSP